MSNHLQKTRPTAYITITFHIFKENNRYVSECTELETSSCGDTIDEALKNIRDATLLYLNTIEEQGERKRIFKERGITLHRIIPQPEKINIKIKNGELVSPSILPIFA